jgi:DivIVA domain-containing protein
MNTQENPAKDVAVLRNRMDADARFHRVLSGYDPQEVRAYMDEVRRVLSRQTNAAKQEEECLIIQINTVKSELAARNCAIRSMKETLTHREAQLDSANARISTLAQAVQKLEAEEKEFKDTCDTVRAAQAAKERAAGLEQETLQLRETLKKAANLIECWKSERTKMAEENTRLRQETEYLKDRFIELSQETQEYMAKAHTSQRQPAEHTLPQQESAQVVSAQIADTFADAFAEAYELVDKFRTNEKIRKPAPAHAVQPRIRVLRPNGTAVEVALTGE